jgi:Putative Ig domain
MRKESLSFIRCRLGTRLLLPMLLLLQVNGTLFGQGGGNFRILTDSLPDGTVGTPYSQTFQSAGTSTAPYTWSLASGTLPPGLTLLPSGVLSGIPTTAGKFKIKIRVVDSSAPQKTVQKDFDLTIDPLVLSMTTTSPLPAGTVGTSYTQTFTATGGTTPYTWSREAGSLPAGLTFTAGGTLSGTPTAGGSFNFTIRVTDSGATPQNVQKVFSLSIATPVSITTNSTLPSGVEGTSYSQTLAATGGTAPYTWALATGSLPDGLSVSPSGIIGGTPTANGSFNLTIRATDSGTPPQTTQKAFSLTIATALSITTGSTLPPGIVGTSYSQTLTAANGTAPYTWTLVAGSLPGGLSLSASGTISGTPTAEGSFDFTIRATDNGSTRQSTQKAFSVAIVSALSITTSSPLPPGTVGTSYSRTLAATGGTAPYTWSLASGSLPGGLSLSSGGVISGTPAVEGTFNFTIRVTDTAQQNSQKAFSLTIVPAGAPLSITTTSPLPSGVVGTRYSRDLQASGGTVPYRWTIRSGVLPQGLTLSSDGVLSGTPTSTGPFSFTVRATDSSSQPQMADQAFTMTIDNPSIPALTLTAVPGDLNPTQQQPITLAVSAPYPSPLSGSLTISFTPNAVAAADDPMVMFSNGSRTASFNIPANGTAAVFSPPVLLLTGTVAGSINLTATLQGNQPQRIGTVNVRLMPPQLRNVVGVRTSGGLRVEVTGYSPERRVQRVDFQFRVRTSAGLESVNLGRIVEPEFENWYRSSSSTAFGSSFLYMQSFVVQGDIATIESVIITLTNAQGSTSSSIIAFSN